MIIKKYIVYIRHSRLNPSLSIGPKTGLPLSMLSS
jgi:hypothetical protein